MKKDQSFYTSVIALISTILKSIVITQVLTTILNSITFMAVM